MMMYFRHLITAPRPSRRTFLWVVVGAFALVATLRVVPLPDFAVSFAHTIGTPLWYLKDVLVGIASHTRATLQNTTTLVLERESLQAEVSRLQRENQYARMLLRENERLRTLLGTGTAHDGRIPTAILHAQEVSPYDTFVIDVGADDGVREGMLVTTAEASVLGVVSRVVAETSIVRALTAPGMVTDTLLMGDAIIPLQVVGMGAGTMVGALPRDTQVGEGVLVTLPGASALPLGIVVSVRADSEDAYQQIFVAPLENTQHVRYAVVQTMEVWRPSDGTFPDTPFPGSNASTTPEGAEGSL